MADGDIVWWELEHPHPERFQKFHAELWGWTFRAAFEDIELGGDYWIIESATGAALGGIQRVPDAVTATRGGVRLYVEVADLEDAFDRSVAAGARVGMTRTDLGGDDRWFGIITDPTGVSLGLWTDQPAPGGEKGKAGDGG